MNSNRWDGSSLLPASLLPASLLPASLLPASLLPASLALACLLIPSGCSTLETNRLATELDLVEDASQSQLSLAKLSERHGDPKYASQLYESMLRDDPNDPVANHRMAVIAAQDQKLEKADRHFKTALAHGEPSAELLNDYAYAQYLQHNLDEAEENARKALKLDPQHKAARNNLALILGEKGQFKESLAEFRKVVGEAEAQSNLAYVKAMRGDMEGAEETYHHALQLDSSMRPAAQALVELNDKRQGVIRDASPRITASTTKRKVEPVELNPVADTVGPKQLPPKLFTVSDGPTASVSENKPATTPTGPKQETKANPVSHRSVGSIRQNLSPWQESTW